MLNDKVLMLFDDTSIAGVATTETISANVFDADGSQRRFSEQAASGDAILLNAAINDLGRAGNAMLHVAVASEEILATGGTATLDLILYKHTTATVTSGTEVLRVRVPGIVITTAAAHVKAGKYLFGLLIPKDVFGDTTNFYIGLSAYVNTNTISTGKLNAWIGENRV